MARPLRIEYPGAFYHVTSRGNERKNIFVSSFDRERFLGYLESSVVRYNAVVHVWRLMDITLSALDRDSLGQSFPDHEAYQRRLHNLLQHQAAEGRTSVSGQIQGYSG